MSAKCRSCDAPVVWVQTEAKPDKPSRRMPVDADPETGRAKVTEGGNLVIVGEVGGVPTVRYVKGGRFVSHFSTCPNAKSHRRSK